jgi:hypothetical protein
MPEIERQFREDDALVLQAISTPAQAIAAKSLVRSNHPARVERRVDEPDDVADGIGSLRGNA